MYEIVKIVFGLASVGGVVGFAGLVMYSALHQPRPGMLPDPLEEEKCRWASKWMSRIGIGLLIAFGLLLGAGFLNLD